MRIVTVYAGVLIFALTVPAIAGWSSGSATPINNLNVNDPSSSSSSHSTSSANVNNAVKTNIHNTNDQSQKQTQVQGQSQSNSQGNVSSGNTTMIGGSSTTIHAQPAIAPDLAGLAASAPCMGSTTASAAGGGLVSIGIGFTWTSNHCNDREDNRMRIAEAQQLMSMGLTAQAKAVMCEIPDVSSVMGSECPATGKIALGMPQPETTSAAFVVGSNSANYESPYDHNYAPTPLGRR